MGNLVRHKKLSYGIGALFIFAISLGAAVIAYGGGFLTFDPLNLVAFIISPLGAYTIIYALKTRVDYLYYLSWGLIMFITGLSFALYKILNIAVLFGLLLVLLAAIGLLEYWRRRK